VKLNLSSLKKAIDLLRKALQITADKMLEEQINDDEIDLIKAGVIQAPG